MKSPRHDPTDALEPTPSTSGPVVSAIIPTFNSAAMLRDAIDSIRVQTRPVDEIIVVDDGSADDTREVCRQFPEVQYVHQGNAGASAARNRGASIARGDWLAFLDADDTWEAGKIEIQVAAIGSAPATDFCVTGASVWSQGDSSWHTYSWTGPVEPVYLQRRLLVRNIFGGLCSSMLIRRDAFEAVGGFAAGKCSEDRRIAIDLLHRHRPLVLAEPLIRQRSGPAHFTNPERHRREMVALIEDYEPLFRRIDKSGIWRRRAIARVHERSGMHYLENGDVAAALYDLSLAAIHWPFQPNPWRAFINAAIGRLPHESTRRRITRQSPSR